MNDLWAAFVAAMADLSEPHKAGKANTGTYGYTYLTLPDLATAVRSVFAQHGLAFRQQVTRDERDVAVTTTLVHVSGACWSTEPLTLTARGLSPQDVGSVITYARRYQLAALVGLSGSDDDDAATIRPGAGEPSSAQPSAKRTPAKRRSPAPIVAADIPNDVHASDPGGPSGPRLVSDKQLKFMHTLLKGAGYQSPASIHAYLESVVGRGIASSKDLTSQEASRVIDELNKPKADRVTPNDNGEMPFDPWANEEPAS